MHQRIQRDAFDRLAPTWEAEHGPRSPRRAAFRQRHAYLHRVCQTVPRARVIDVGCGTGAHLRELASVISVGRGIDVSEGMIEQARQRVHPSGDGAQVVFEVLEAEAVRPGPLGTFDIALFVDALEYMEDPVVALGRIAAVVEPGGLIVVLMPRPGAVPQGGVPALESGTDGVPPRCMSPRQIAHAAGRIGWRLSGLTQFRPVEAVAAAGLRPLTPPRATPAGDAHAEIFAARLRRIAPRSSMPDIEGIEWVP